MTLTEKKSRIYTLDSIRGILMILVILGHFMEIIPGLGAKHPMYKIIYSFHMPMFLFLSGFFGKFHWKGILKFSGLYILFQTLYLLFQRTVLWGLPLSGFSPSFQTPYWLLWYLLTLVYYYFSIAVLRYIPKRCYPFAILAAIGISLVSGCFSSVGYPWTLSRTFFFLPYFVTGYFCRQCQNDINKFYSALSVTQKAVYALLSLLTVVGASFLCALWKLQPFMLYGSYSYRTGYGPLTRLQMLVIAFVWIHFLFSLTFLVPKLRIPFLEWIGQHTLPIYLLHGFVVKLCGML